MTFSMDYILEKDNKKYVTVPKGVIRFSKQGRRKQLCSWRSNVTRDSYSSYKI